MLEQCTLTTIQLNHSPLECPFTIEIKQTDKRFDLVVYESKLVQCAFCHGVIVPSALLVDDIWVRPNLRGNDLGTMMLQTLKDLHTDRPILPLAILDEAKEFWAKMKTKFDSPDITEADLLLERLNLFRD